MDPLAFYHPTLAPTGCGFYSGNHYPTLYKNAWFFTNYNGNEIRTVWLDATGSHVVNETIFDQHPGSGYQILTGPDGNLWFLTNDTGGFGANELGRYTHSNESAQSLQISSVSNKTLEIGRASCRERV